MKNRKQQVATRPGTKPGTIPPASLFEDVVRVLVADDDGVTRKILTRTLDEAGYDVIEAKDGDTARTILLSSDAPDIALLDWVMPGCTGPELCTLVRDQVEKFVFIMLVTGRTTQEDMIEGLNSGAHEFLTKPINLAEFNVRMTVASRILEYERTLSKKNQEIARYATQMKDLAETRARQLVHAERLATLGMLSAGIGHEIKNPVAYVAGNMQVIGRYRNDLRTALQGALDSGVGDQKRMKFLLENGGALIEGIEEGLGRIVGILEGLSRFAHRGTGKKAEAYLHQCINDAVDLSRNTWKYHVTVTTDLDDLPPLSLNAQEITQVLVNLLVNASDAMKDRPSGVDNTIHITLKRNGRFQRIAVADNGPGIPDDIRERIWDPFFTTKKEGEGTGLGLAICSGIIEEHRGRITVKNLPDGGACFLIDLPADPQEN